MSYDSRYSSISNSEANFVAPYRDREPAKEKLSEIPSSETPIADCIGSISKREAVSIKGIALSAAIG